MTKLLIVLTLLSASIAKADGISQIRPDYGNGFFGDPIWVLTDGPDFVALTTPSDNLLGIANLVDITCYGTANCLFQYYYEFFSSGNTDYYLSAQINNEVEIVGFDQPSTQSSVIVTTPEPPTGILVLLVGIVVVLKRLLW